MKKDGLLWYDRKRIWCGLPWSFTQYGQSDDRLFIERGFLNKREDEVRLYRVINLTLTKTLFQRIFGLSTIHVDSTDKAMRSFEILNIKNGEMIKEVLSEAVEKERLRNRVSSREIMVDDGSDDFDDHDIDNDTDDDNDSLDDNDDN